MLHPLRPEIPAQRVPDRLFVRVPIARQEIDRRQDHARRAKAALEPVVLHERLLHWVQLAFRGQPLDRRHLGAFRLEREQRAALHGPAVDEDGAGAALARVAADVRASQPQTVAQGVNEERASLDVQRALLAVDAQLKLRHLA
jgi:hypothetical protein